MIVTQVRSMTLESSRRRQVLSLLVDTSKMTSSEI